MEQLSVALNLYHWNDLQNIAREHGLYEKRARVLKAWAVKQLSQQIPQHASSSQNISALTKVQQAILALLIQAGGSAKPLDLLKPLVLSGLLHLPAAGNGKGDLTQLERELHNLLIQGLVLNINNRQQSNLRTFSPLGRLIIPAEVMRVLPRELLSIPKPQPERYNSPPPDQVEAAEPEIFLRRLFFTWAELRREPGTALKAGGIYKRDVKRIAASMGQELTERKEEEIRDDVAFLRWMGLVARQDKAIAVPPAAEEGFFWQQPLTEQLRKVITTLANHGQSLHVNLRAIDSTQLGYHNNPELYPPAYLFNRVVEFMEEMAQVNWMPFATSLIFLNGAQPGHFIFPAEGIRTLFRNATRYHWRGSSKKRKKRLRLALSELEQDLLRQILIRLHESGIVELGYQAQQEDSLPQAWQLSPLAEALFTEQSWEEPAERGQVVLQPDFHLLAMGPVPLKTLVAIEQLAVREKIQPAAISYRVTKESIYRALQEGQSVPGIISALETMTELPVAQNVRRTLQEWGKQHERIVIQRDVLVVQVAQAELLNKLLAQPKLAQILHPVDERTAWLASEDAQRIERALSKEKLLPAHSQGPEEDLPSSLCWQDDEVLHARVPLPSLYTTGNINQIAERAGSDWRLTPKSISAAVTAGHSVPEICQLLTQMTGEELSPSWKRRIKAWGHYFGAAQTSKVRLLHLKDAATLAELRRSDSNLKRWLRPLQKGASDTAVVQEKNWDKVSARLAEWGIELTEGHWW